MRLAGGLTAILLTVPIVITQPLVTAALTPPEIASIVQQITIRIDGANTGSGVIIERSKNIYTVVTNWHVLQEKGKYTVHTPDGRQYTVSNIKRLPGIDLATFQFNSNQNYRVAAKGNSDQVTRGKSVYVGGYPQGISDLQFLTGLISRIVSKPQDGYALVYKVDAYPGMSGGPILDEQGKLVGIHGRTYTRYNGMARDVFGIPLKTYLRLAPSTPPPQPQTIPNINTSSVRMDYTQLRNLLAAGKWKEADSETNRVMLAVAKTRGLSWRSGEWNGNRSNISRFPCSDIQTIDKLWTTASNGRFGFSIQNKIWENLGGAIGRYQDSTVSLWHSYNEIIGTRMNGRDLNYNELNFTTSAPRGHLPALSSGYNIDFSIMRITAANCGLR